MFRGVLFDWRGTLVADPPDEWWVRRALARVGRGDEDVAQICEQLTRTSTLPEVVDAERTLDCSPELHRAGTLRWFALAGLDDELANALYDLDFDPQCHQFFPDVADALQALRDLDCSVALVSDIHFDLRPEFAAAGVADLVDAFVLSFEHGVQKPDPAIFDLALAALDLTCEEALMVGDRDSHDGGAASAGIATLLLPRLPDATSMRGLDAIVRLVHG